MTISEEYRERAEFVVRVLAALNDELAAMQRGEQRDGDLYSAIAWEAYQLHPPLVVEPYMRYKVKSLCFWKMYEGGELHANARNLD